MDIRAQQVAHRQLHHWQKLLRMILANASRDKEMINWRMDTSACVTLAFTSFGIPPPRIQKNNARYKLTWALRGGVAAVPIEQ